MLSEKMIWENLTSPSLAQVLIQWLLEESEEFAEDHQKYIDAMDALRKDLGDAVTEEANAIEQQCASNLLFSGFLGLKANLDNFKDPVARNFLDVDFEVYLREEIAHRLPEYAQAQDNREQFFSRLTLEQREIYQDVSTYASHLETVGPKLAHYFGYLLGNTLLPKIIPGYCTDPVLTIKYSALLGKYMGENLLPMKL